MAKYLMLCSVGTSFWKKETCRKEEDKAKELLERLEERDSSEIPPRESIEPLLSLLLPEECKKWGSIPWEGDWDNHRSDEIGGIFPTAELQSTFKWFARKANTEKELEVELVLWPSKEHESRLTARIFKLYAPRLFKKLLTTKTNVADLIKIKPLDINVDDEVVFAKSIQVIYQQYNESAKEFLKKNPSGKVILNTTGGYKSIAGYLLLYGQIMEFPCIYTFENKNYDIVEMMSLPVGFALPMLDEEMSLLKALTAGAKDKPIQAFLRDHRACLPEWIRFMVSDDPEAKPNPVAEQYVEYYKKNRRAVTGEGRNFLKLLPDNGGVREYISSRINTEWGELWLGDQIPETVEHSRRHSKRLMETAANLYRCAEGELKTLGLEDPLPLAILISAIYLHDIGHTAIGAKARTAGENGPEIPLTMFPSAVREMHHLLSHHRILEKGETLFPDDGNPELATVLRKVVPWVCAYHRGYTTLLNQQGKTDLSEKPLLKKTGDFLYGEDFDRFLAPLEERLERDKILEGLPEGYEIEPEIVLRVTALLRILDGCDAQADRTVDETYLKARLERTREEAQFLQNCLEPLEGELDFRDDLHEFMKTAGHLDVESACRGSFEEGIAGKIDEGSKRLYSTIFDSLLAIARKDGANAFSKQPALIQALSLANRIVFKWEQFLHFYKHRCIDFVLPVRSGEKIHILVWPNQEPGIGDEGIKEMLNVVVKGISEEFEKVSKVLEGLTIETNSPNGWPHE